MYGVKNGSGEWEYFSTMAEAQQRKEEIERANPALFVPVMRPNGTWAEQGPWTAPSA